MKRFAVDVTLVVGIAGMGLLAGCSRSVRLGTASYVGNKGGPKTFVTLVQQMDGSCKATDGVGVLGGKKNDKITWYVTNNCNTKQYLTFTHYQERLDPTDPTNLGPVVTDIVDPDPKYDDVEEGGDTKVDATINKENSSGKDKLYKYWICVGTSAKPMTNCLDPDVDVWP